MTGSQIYVRLDTISNAVTSKGITLKDFQQATTTFPQNILLLMNDNDLGELEANTGLRMVRGEETIRQFFNQYEHSHNIKWIDFQNIDLIRQMKPIEIAELLYFGHMKSQLHSPFFYKLQNNFVYFDEENNFGKVYYRRMNEFYAVLQKAIERHLEKQVNANKWFFKKPTKITSMSEDFLEELNPILQEGILFDFIEVKEEKCWAINMYIVEDKIRSVLSNDSVVAIIKYYSESGIWTLEKQSELFEGLGISQN